jgi:hypothetical protein
MIDINHGRLRSIHQSDLAPFPNLVCLELFENDLQVLEEDLFKFNVKLQMVWVSNNKIFHVAPTAFAGVTQLRHISFFGNPCTSQFVKDNATAASLIVASAIDKCVDLKELEKQFPSLMKTIASIERELARLDEKIEEKSLMGYRGSDDGSSHLGEIFIVVGGFVVVGVIGMIVLKKFGRRSQSKGRQTRIEFENSGGF